MENHPHFQKWTPFNYYQSWRAIGFCRRPRRFLMRRGWSLARKRVREFIILYRTWKVFENFIPFPSACNALGLANFGPSIYCCTLQQTTYPLCCSIEFTLGFWHKAHAKLLYIPCKQAHTPAFSFLFIYFLFPLVSTCFLNIFYYIRMSFTWKMFWKMINVLRLIVFPCFKFFNKDDKH